MFNNEIFEKKIKNAGYNGRPFSWGSDGVQFGSGFSQAEMEAINTLHTESMVLDTSAFEEYRDAYWQKSTTVNSMSISFSPSDADTINRLIEQIKVDDVNGTIDFTAVDGIYTLGVSDLQNIIKEMKEKEQQAREAYNAVIAVHEVTPYSTIEDMITAFNAEVA